MTRFELQYIRTDRNGTKYYADINCPRCCGYGELDRWAFTGRVCYGCGGTGKRPQPKMVKVYTPEHEAKLEARREEKAKATLEQREEETQKAQEETRVRAWVRLGFTKEGTGFAHYGETYKNRERLKAAGAKWCMMMKAYIAPRQIDIEGVKTFPVTANDICNPWGDIDTEKAWEFAKNLK